MDGYRRSSAQRRRTGSAQVHGLTAERVCKLSPSCIASSPLSNPPLTKSFLQTFASVLVLNIVSQLYFLRLIPSLLPPSADLPDNRFHFLIECLTNSLNCTYLYAQISLNHRARTFAGRHKLAALLDAFESALTPLAMLPVIGGRWEQRPGWGLETAVTFAFMAMYAYQAWTLPKVQGGDAEEE